MTMREILFRAKTEPCCKDVITGEILEKPKWIYGYIDLGYMRDGQGAIISDEKGNKAYRCQYSTIGQYIGQTDKNGEKIFEGDILQYFDDEIQVVEWSDEWSQIMLHTYGEHERKIGRKIVKEKFEGWNFLNEYPLEDMPKIGNIHDNPELLEGGQNNAIT